ASMPGDGRILHVTIRESTISGLLPGRSTASQIWIDATHSRARMGSNSVLVDGGVFTVEGNAPVARPFRSCHESASAIVGLLLSCHEYAADATASLEGLRTFDHRLGFDIRTDGHVSYSDDRYSFTNDVFFDPDTWRPFATQQRDVRTNRTGAQNITTI